MICDAKVKKKTVKSGASGENARPVDNNILLTLPPICESRRGVQDLQVPEEKI